MPDGIEQRIWVIRLLATFTFCGLNSSLSTSGAYSFSAGEKPAFGLLSHCIGVRTPLRSSSQMLSPMPISSP
jgi:hypothetical protein